MWPVVICEAFGWTYFEYLDQPVFFIDLIKEKMRIDSENVKRQTNKVKP